MPASGASNPHYTPLCWKSFITCFRGKSWIGCSRERIEVVSFIQEQSETGGGGGGWLVSHFGIFALRPVTLWLRAGWCKLRRKRISNIRDVRGRWGSWTKPPAPKLHQTLFRAKFYWIHWYAPSPPPGILGLSLCAIGKFQPNVKTKFKNVSQTPPPPPDMDITRRQQ